MAKPLDKDLKKLARLEAATASQARALAMPALALLFVAVAGLYAAQAVAPGPLSAFVVAAVVVAGYLALNIGANDVANNVGPAVGARALTMGGALLIAAVCEASGAILAGGDVVETVAKGIIAPPPDMGAREFILVMISALFAAAVWLNLATVLRAPVSTTHSIVGGVLGAGIAAAGFGVVDWATMGGIAASWVISPVLGGIAAAAMLAFIKWRILFKADRVSAARRWVPVLFGVMIAVFTLYMLSKGLKRLWSPSGDLALVMAVVSGLAGWLLARPWVRRRSEGMENRRKQISRLFVLPLVMAAALLSFAHGANDVANAVGPLAAIAAVAQSGQADVQTAALPDWILILGGLGISLGLALFGPRLIRTVGEQITKIDPMRAYCVALAAAGTVLLASALGLPVSSTHIALGGVFGVGLLREVLTNNGVRRRDPALAAARADTPLSPKGMKKLRKREKRRLVRRRHLFSIAAAWGVTVPATAAVAALLLWILRLVFG